MITARELAQQLEADLAGNETAWDRPLLRLAPLDKAGPDALGFLASNKYRRQLATSAAGAILLKADQCAEAPAGAALIVVDDPYLAYARVSSRFSRQPPATGRVHPSAVVSEHARLGEQVTVEANAVIGDGCDIGDGCRIGPGCVLGDRVRLGRRTQLMANVTLYYDVSLGEDCLVQSGAVIGGDGFGYAPHADGWAKIAQLGGVRIGDRVEIGANTTIDRGAIDDTVIEDDVIIDNLVQIAHNVVVRRGTAMASQVGISGSTEIGRGCTLGGQAGVAGHIRIADGSHFTGQAMVTKGTREGGLYSSGWPIQPSPEWRRTVARLRQLEKLEQRLKALEEASVPEPPSDKEDPE